MKGPAGPPPVQVERLNVCAPPTGTPSDEPVALNGTRVINVYSLALKKWTAIELGDPRGVSDSLRAALGGSSIALNALGCVGGITSTGGTTEVQVFATSVGVADVGPFDGHVHVYSGLPAGGSAISLLPHFNGTFLVGRDSAPAVFSCQIATDTCDADSAGIPGAVTRANVFATVVGTDIVGTDHGAFRFTSSVWSPVGGLETTPVTEIGVAGSAGPVFFGTDAGLYVSSDRGATASRAAAIPAEPVTGLAVSGSVVAAYAATHGFFHSTDSGTTFAPRGPIPGASHVGSLTTFQGSVLAGADIGIVRSTDGGLTWSPFSSGVAGGTVYQYATGSAFTVAASDTGLWRRNEGTETWALLDPAPERVVMLAGNDIFAFDTAPTRSVDGGQTFTHDAAGLPSGSTPFSAASSGSRMFITFPLFGIFSSGDGGATWTRPVGLPPTISATAVATDEGDQVMVGTQDGRTFVSTDGGARFSETTRPSAGTAVSSLGFQGTDVAAGLSGSGGPVLVLSHDLGSSWTRADTGLGGNVLSIASAPSSSQRRRPEALGPPTLFAGTASGLYRSTDSGSSWSLVANDLFGTSVRALSASSDQLFVGTAGLAGRAYALPLRVKLIVPVVLDVASGTAHYTTELSLTNRGKAAASVALGYTASLGTGSGTVDEDLAAGQQKVIPDVIAYLRGKGLAIPGTQAGTLVLSFTGVDSPDVVAATARTTSATSAPQPIGSAGLAYPAVPIGSGSTTRRTVYGLRSNATDRSNLAVYNTTDTPVTLKVTAFSGAGDGKSVVIAASDTLGPYGWKQYNGILATAGFTTGYATVERVSDTGAFGLYAVVNDNGTNDGSFLAPRTEGGLFPYLNVPVLVETSSFRSELVLANSGTAIANAHLTYAESLDAAGGSGTVTVTLTPGTQQIIPNAIDFLRSKGVPIGPAGRSYAGSLHILLNGVSIEDFYAAARTASPSPAGGQFGLFTPAIYPGAEAGRTAYLYGLRADANDRSNVAVVNTGTAGAGSITLRVQAYDGDAGGVAKGAPKDVTLAPGQWIQLNNFLGASGVANGWVEVTLVSGDAPWIAYAAINDGGAPGQRTGDAAYVAMSR